MTGTNEDSAAQRLEQSHEETTVVTQHAKEAPEAVLRQELSPGADCPPAALRARIFAAM